MDLKGAFECTRLVVAVFHLKTGCIGPQEKYTVDNFVYHNKKQHVDLNMPVKSICDNCIESFSTLKLLEYHTETKHTYHYAKALTLELVFNKYLKL